MTDFPAPSLDIKSQERFSKLVGMLGSSSAGERATAAKLATELLMRNGLTWADVSAGREQDKAAAQKGHIITSPYVYRGQQIRGILFSGWRLQRAPAAFA
jgi:hypothetical protein